MLFSRRNPLRFWGHVRHTLWPRKGWARPFVYRAKCTLRLKDNAHAIAIGVACGAFVSFTPLMGLHILLACAVAWALSGNIVAAALGTAVGNPFTFPPIWLASYRSGSWMLGRSGAGEGKAENFGHVVHNAMTGERPFHEILIGMWEPLIWPMMVGGVPLGILAGVGMYFLTRSAVVAFQATRLHAAAAREVKSGAARVKNPPNGSATA